MQNPQLAKNYIIKLEAKVKKLQAANNKLRKQLAAETTNAKTPMVKKKASKKKASKKVSKKSAKA